jgi:hypothetical protein
LEIAMIRLFATLALVASVAPATLYADTPAKGNGTKPAKATASASKGSMNKSSQKGSSVTKDVAKASNHKVTKVDSTKKFPKVNNDYKPKAPNGAAKFGNMNFDAHYHLKHGHKFAHGYYFSGKHHRHWQYRIWDAYYGTFIYWCPNTLVYYYWCEPCARFNPVTYCPHGTYSWTDSFVAEDVPLLVTDDCGCGN